MRKREDKKMQKMEKSFGLRLPAEVKDWAKQEADKQDRSVNSLVVQIMRQSMKKSQEAAE